ncbi:hypothetical protein ACIGG5_32315 [Streptomyces sp. NPDC085463]|uniref:hypothetical protein n=1 Tax=Streptomyces sp. NPDC085463 TaxID=3365724 RepID=UPI0037CD1B97
MLRTLRRTGAADLTARLEKAHGLVLQNTHRRSARAWSPAVAEQIPGEPQVVDYGVPVAAEARHRAEILGREVYPEPHHKAAALLCELARNPSLEMKNLLFAATVTAACLSACGMPVRPGLDTVLPLARAARDGLPVREVTLRLR